LKVIAFNVNGIGRQLCELNKQLHDLHTDVALFSDTHLRPYDRFSVPNYHFYRTNYYPGRKGIPHNHVDLPPLVSVEVTGVCIPAGNREVLLAAVYKSSGCA
jgi:exonuclease III